jgi:hypothetical protein
MGDTKKEERMRALDWLKYLRDKSIGPTSKEGSKLGPYQ